MLPTFEGEIWKNIGNDAMQDISYDGILRCYDQGNDLLGGQYKASAVSVHDPEEFIAGAGLDEDLRVNRMNELLNAYCALRELKESGKLISVGIGSKDLTMIECIVDQVPLDWVMIACAYTIHSHSERTKKLLLKLHSKGIHVINAAVFNSGFLLGKQVLCVLLCMNSKNICHISYCNYCIA